MKRHYGIVLAAVALATTAAVNGCSSSPDRSSRGSMSVNLSASPAADQTAEPQIVSAQLTISELEAHRAGGAWVPFETSSAFAIDVLALATGGGSVNLPSELMPEGQYDALQVRVARVELSAASGASETISPPGTGWGVTLPADFAVIAGRETTVNLIVRVDRTFRRINDQIEFEPEFEIGGVAHD